MIILEITAGILLGSLALRLFAGLASLTWSQIKTLAIIAGTVAFLLGGAVLVVTSFAAAHQIGYLAGVALMMAMGIAYRICARVP